MLPHKLANIITIKRIEYHDSSAAEDDKPNLRTSTTQDGPWAEPWTMPRNKYEDLDELRYKAAILDAILGMAPLTSHSQDSDKKISFDAELIRKFMISPPRARPETVADNFVEYLRLYTNAITAEASARSNPADVGAKWLKVECKGKLERFVNAIDQLLGFRLTRW